MLSSRIYLPYLYLAPFSKYLTIWLLNNVWPLASKCHLGSKKIKPFEILVNIYKDTQNSKMWPFICQGHESVFIYHGKGTSSHQTTLFERLRMKISSDVYRLNPCLRAQTVRNTRVSLARGKTLPFSVQTVDGWLPSSFKYLTNEQTNKQKERMSLWPNITWLKQRERTETVY